MSDAFDDFFRSDEFPIQYPWLNWTGGDIYLIGGAVQYQSFGLCLFYYDQAASSADQYSEATETSDVVNEDWGPAVRIGGDSSLSAYIVTPYTNQLRIGKWVAGSYTQLASYGGYASGTPLRVEVAGDLIRGFYGGVQFGAVNDTSLVGQGVGAGLFFEDAGGFIDDWSGGDVGAGPSAPAVNYSWAQHPKPPLRRA